MDGIKRTKLVRPRSTIAVEKRGEVTQKPPRLARFKALRFLAKGRKYLPSRRKHPILARIGWGALAVILLGTMGIEIFNLRRAETSYYLSSQVKNLIGESTPFLAQNLESDSQLGTYEFNKGYQPGVDVAGETAGAKFSASFNKDPEKGVTVTDPLNQTSITFTPDFAVAEPRQDQNRLIYPLKRKDGVKVYTLKATGMKEDIVLNSFQGDELTFRYKLALPDGTEARMESNGSLAIYGVSPTLLGNVSTGSGEDEALLKKARENGEKNTLLFTFPAPFVLESNKKTSEAKSWFSLENNELTVHAANLRQATYPISIDPSVYVETATKLMRGNNETNLDFDVSNELIQKGKLTGARFDSWTSTMALPAARWNHGTAVAGGNAYVAGGSSGSTNVATVYWAKFNTTTGVIESPNPGAGACTNWCTNSAYDLPAARAGLSLVAYNGYLYAFGGVDGAGARSNSTYIAKLGANGEPSLWHPTDTNKNNWVYWYTASNLSSERSYASAVAYNNRMYLMGGQTNASTGGVTTVEVANISPIGTLSSWSTTGMVVLPSARHNHSVQVYNDRLYLIGGNSSGTLQNSVHYIKINSDGTLAGSWTATTSFNTARMAWGGSFSTMWGGYIYVASGCSAINGSGYCTTIAGDVQLASINADGSITNWGSIAGVTSARIGYGFVGWRGVLYGIGGCTAHNTTTGNCTTTATTTQYGKINQDGDASTVSNSVPSGTAPCSGGAPFDCDLPPVGDNAGQGGRMSGGAVLNNGFIYIIGGCTDISGSSECLSGTGMSGNVSYAALAVDGTLVSPATCGGTASGSWCVDSTNRLNGTAGLGAFSYTIFNNVIYVYGGTDGSTWQNQVWYVALNANGSLSGAWTAQAAGTGAGQTGLPSADDSRRGYSYMFARANPAAASTLPGNLYIIGGCKGANYTDDGLGCSDYYSDVYKCSIATTGALSTTTQCTTTNQLQLDSEPGGAANGLGLMAGVVYANYVYLVGGSSPNSSERGEVMYAKIDNSNNIVDADGETVTDNIWTTSPNEMNPIRRRGFAFGYNGYLYALAGYNGTSSLNDLLLAKIDVSDGSIGGFTESLVTVNPRWDLRAIVSSGYVYAFGGCSTGAPPGSCTALTGAIQTFQLYNNYSGSPATHTASANLFAAATDRWGSSATVLNGYIYAAGGCVSATNCTDATNNVQYAALAANGSIGTWASTTANLGGDRAWGQLETAGGSLYYIGGQDDAGTAQTTVYYGTPSSGNVTSWTAASNGLPSARSEISAASWNNRLYVTGGAGSGTGCSGGVCNTVFVSPSLSGGGNISSAWSSSTGFNVARSGHTTVAYANNLYVFGGFDGTNYLNDAQFTQINSDGTVDAWGYTTSLPHRMRQADGFAANGFMYLFGGRSAASTCTNNTYVAPISANTTIASGNNPTGVGEWYQTNVEYTGDRYGAATAYDQGKAYIIGGGCTAPLAANRAYYSALQSQPQVAKYSRMIDTDTDVFPTKWLMNGLDNSIGARWLMRYRSSTNSAAAWGQETNFGTVTLGQPETYTPLDSGGANTNFARYYYLSVTIDSSQAFGYPEDISRGPTLADLSIFFSSDPSKRLRHGKTFTGGEQQPLDTPF